jgi:hypothetical protein
VAGQQGAVGGHGQVAHPGHLADQAGQLHDPALDQGLPSGKADLGQSQAHRGAHHLHDLLVAQEVFVPPQRHALLRQAIATAQVALVRDGNAQVIDAAL